MPRRLVALLAVAVLAAAACGDSEEPQTERDPDSREQDAPPDDDGALAVRAVDFGFDPTELEVDPGSRVSIEVTNGGSVAHSFTVEDADVDVTVDAGGTELAGFQAPGEDATLEFFCRFHSDQMRGTITVGAGGSGAGGGGGGGGGGSGSDDFDY